LADIPLVLFNIVSAHVDRSRTVRPRLVNRLSLTFSDISNMFQMGIIVVTSTVDRSALGHGSSACAQNLC
jgi:hypothetical protein